MTSRRQIKNVTRRALERFLAAYEDVPTPKGRKNARAARAALAGLDGPPRPDLREPYIARFKVGPGLHVTIDATFNIMLEVRTADEAELLAAYPVGDVGGFADTLANCRSLVRIAVDDGPEVARVVGRDWAGSELTPEGTR